jgi:hypothetical protein
MFFSVCSEGSVVSDFLAFGLAFALRSKLIADFFLHQIIKSNNE